MCNSVKWKEINCKPAVQMCNVIHKKCKSAKCKCINANLKGHNLQSAKIQVSKLQNVKIKKRKPENAIQKTKKCKMHCTKQ